MSTFIQLHLLTSYPPANLNRDDLGRPKTAVMGGTQRLRISSQSLKRAWRTSEVFESELSDNIGIRTKIMGRKIFEALKNGFSLIEVVKQSSRQEREPVDEKRAMEVAKKIAGQFGKSKKGTDEDPGIELEIEQIVHISPVEIELIDGLLEKVSRGEEIEESEYDLLREQSSAVDIAMFGRMLADKPSSNIEAAVQVSHAISTHKVAIEDDYFTAVDDLNKGEVDMGAAHIGDRGFGAGLFYLYICVNRDLLVENLKGNTELASKALKALVETAATVSPSGMQNSFGSRAYASYILAEKGTRQPRSLAAAFLKAVESTTEGYLKESIKKIEKLQSRFDKAYGKCAADTRKLDVLGGEGSIEEIKEFAVN